MSWVSERRDEGLGELQFRGPNSLVVDQAGDMIVSDSLNGRMQVVDMNQEFLGFVEVEKLLN